MRNNGSDGLGLQRQVFFGVDFGTTNRSVALLQPGREARLIRFHFVPKSCPPCRSVLYFGQSKTASGQRRVHGYSGPEAIERYFDTEKRLIVAVPIFVPMLAQNL